MISLVQINSLTKDESIADNSWNIRKKNLEYRKKNSEEIHDRLVQTSVVLDLMFPLEQYFPFLVKRPPRNPCCCCCPAGGAEAVDLLLEVLPVEPVLALLDWLWCGEESRLTVLAADDWNDMDCG